MPTVRWWRDAIGATQMVSTRTARGYTEMSPLPRAAVWLAPLPMLVLACAPTAPQHESEPPVAPVAPPPLCEVLESRSIGLARGAAELNLDVSPWACAQWQAAQHAAHRALRCYREAGALEDAARALELLENQAATPPPMDCPAAELSPPDCAKSQACTLLGACHTRGGRCSVADESDCERATACDLLGWCTPLGGLCLRATDADCSSHRLQCKELGRCSAGDAGCVATDGTCRRSNECLRGGACAEVDGGCRPTFSPHCRISGICHRYGSCAFDEVEEQCLAASTEHCAASVFSCGYHGRCTYRDGSCVVASAADCRESRLCKEYGYCAVDDDSCVPGTRRDCAAATRCRPDPLPRHQPAPPPRGKPDGGGIVVLGQRYPLAEGVRVVTFADDRAWDISTERGEDPDGGPLIRTRMGGAETLAALRRQVSFIVLHADLTFSARRTRGLMPEWGRSTHFLIDFDGTIYQLADVAVAARHTASADDRSVGVTLNNRLQNLDPDRSGPVERHLIMGRDRAHMTEYGYERTLSEAAPVQGGLQRTLGYTDAQYRSLIALTRTLTAVLGVRAELPVDRKGDVYPHMLRGPFEERWLEQGGVAAHYHLEDDRWDPGPALDWQRLRKGLE